MSAEVVTVEKKNSYLEFKEVQEKELDRVLKECGVFFAFSKEQLDEKLKELGITREDLKRDYAGFYGGGVIRKDKAEIYRQFSDRRYIELKEKMKSDFEFAKTAFRYEMSNYECFISGRFDEVLGILSLTLEELEQDEQLKKAFKEAREEYWNWCIENE